MNLKLLQTKTSKRERIFDFLSLLVFPPSVLRTKEGLLYFMENTKGKKVFWDVLLQEFITLLLRNKTTCAQLV